MHNGRIAAVGQTLDPAEVFGKMVPELTRIDAKGKHITPGILDEHTHIAASRGINEGTKPPVLKSASGRWSTVRTSTSTVTSRVG